MEYTGGLMEVYITESGNRIIKMVKGIRGGQMEMNIAENTRMVSNRERESVIQTDNYTE
jgi:hypothetical protein